MKKITKLMAIALCATVMGAGTAAFAGCGGSEEGDTSRSGEITITGSTSVGPLMKKLAGAYEEKYPNVVINISETGSTEGVTDAINGANDFGMASRALKSGELDKGVVSKKIADDGIAIIVNTACTVTNVTKAEVKALYESGTSIQDKLKGALSREDGSGTKSAFQELIGIKTLYSGTGFEDGISSTSAVLTKIKNNAQANLVGYISLGSLNSDVKAVKFEGVEATVANVSNGTYTLARPFNIVYKSEASLSEAAKLFIEYIESEDGKAIITENHYIPVA